MYNCYYYTIYLSNSDPLHMTGASVHGGPRRDGKSGCRRAAQNADDGTVRLEENSFSYPLDDERMIFWVCSWKHEQEKFYVNLRVESKTRTHYGPVGSRRRTANRRGGARLGRTGRRRVEPASRQPSLLPSSESKTLVVCRGSL